MPSTPNKTKPWLPSRVYNVLINTVDKYVPQRLQPVWNHPVGPKTVFFWSPLVKWGLVVAGLGDLNRSAETISMRQSATLAATGLVWSRYCLVIIPKNWALFSVNMFVGLVQSVQFIRAYRCQTLKKEC